MVSAHGSEACLYGNGGIDLGLVAPHSVSPGIWSYGLFSPVKQVIDRVSVFSELTSGKTN